ncbi:MAG: hypothetical protein HRT87_09960 [Legionellales bacterium]|nr:hypothetical protein [Legionellales bacterium]
MARIFIAFFQRDFYKIAYLHKKIGWIESDVELAKFADEIRILSEPIFDKPLKDISFGYLVLKLVQVGRKFNMHVQPHLLLFQKTLFAIEGLGKQLYPELNIWKIAESYFSEWKKQRIIDELNPIKNADMAFDIITTIPKLPEALHEALVSINKNNIANINQNINKNYRTQNLLYFMCGFGLAILLIII